nr:poly(3-hydroxybutyric acid) granule-associated 40 kda protein=phaCCv product {N-terminal} [Chromatium vinosum, D, DSM 180, Peptide Partial, 15 aa] [Allochromatium vinosum]
MFPIDIRPDKLTQEM